MSACRDNSWVGLPHTEIQVAVGLRLREEGRCRHPEIFSGLNEQRGMNEADSWAHSRVTGTARSHTQGQENHLLVSA